LPGKGTVALEPGSVQASSKTPLGAKIKQAVEPYLPTKQSILEFAPIKKTKQYISNRLD
jgi:hypothetical protein